MEPRAKKIRLDSTQIPASIPEEVRTYEEWASYPVDVLQLVCSQVGLAPAGSVHEMAQRLVGFFQLAGAGAAGGPGTSPAGGNASNWSPSAAPVASVPAVPPPVAPPMVPPFQFARLGLAADVPEEVIQPFHDLAQEVVPLRGDELTSFFRDAIRREAIALAQAWSVPPASCAAAPVSVPTLLPPAPPAAPAPSSPARPTSHGSVSHSGLATPPPLLEKLRTGGGVPVQSMRAAAHADDGAVPRLGVALTLRRRLLDNSVAASTSRVYGSGLNQYLAFCREVGIPHPFPLREFVLELFVALLRTYLAGLQHFSFRFGFPMKVAGMHSLGFVLRGLRRSQADRFTRPPRRPITVTTLILLRAYIHRRFPARDAVMLLAAILSAFFGLLRSAEYCSPSPRRFDPAVHLQYRDLTLDPARGVASLRIKASKTDPFREGASVRLCRTGSALCPFTALHQLLGAHPTFVGPLFAFQDGSYLTRAPLGAHPPGGLSFLLRPQHPLLPHRGRVRRGGHGFLLGHDPGPRAVAGRLLPALRPAPSQVRVPRPTKHAEVFGVTRGGRACGRGGGARRLALL